MKNARKLIAGAVLLKVLGAAGTFLFTVLVARAMEKDAAGATFLFVSAFVIASTLGRFGFGNVVMRYAAIADPPDARLLRQVALVCFGTASLATVGTLVALSLTSIQDVLPLGRIALPFAGSAIIAALTVVGAFVLRGLGSTWLSVWMQTGAIQFGVLMICGILWLASGGLSVESVALAYVVSSLVSLAWLILGSRLKQAVFAPRPAGPSELRRLIADARPLAVLEAMQLATQWVPALLLAAYVTVEAVADYHISARVAFLAHFILFGITTVVSPKLAKLHAEGRIDELAQLYRWACRMSLFAGGIPLAVLLFFPQTVLSLFGDQYVGTQTLQILAVGQIINMGCGPVVNLLMMSNLQAKARNAGIFGGLLALASAFLLAPFLGAAGVAIGVTLSVVAQNLLAMYYADRYIGVSLFRPKSVGVSS